MPTCAFFDPAYRMGLAPSSRVCLFVATLTFALGFGGMRPVSAQLPPSEENSVKAAFVYNFAKFTDWPDEMWKKAEKLRLCLAGKGNGFAHALVALGTKPPVRGKEVEVLTLSRNEDPTGCQILVIRGQDGTAPWLRSVRDAPVLTVGDGEGFAASGGVIGLFAEGDKLRFEVNQDAAQRAGLKLSSQLLKLARLVKDPAGGKP